MPRGAFCWFKLYISHPQASLCFPLNRLPFPLTLAFECVSTTHTFKVNTPFWTIKCQTEGQNQAHLAPQPNSHIWSKMWLRGCGATEINTDRFTNRRRFQFRLQLQLHIVRIWRWRWDSIKNWLLLSFGYGFKYYFVLFWNRLVFLYVLLWRKEHSL